MTRFIAFLLMVVTLAFAPSALAYTPPPMTAHVTDTAHKLTEPERLAIDRKLEDYRVKTTNEIAVFIPASLEGEEIEAVAFATFRAWHLGVKGKDNGVLLVVAPVERKSWLTTGKGVEGALTDLQSNDIARNDLKPHLTPGHEDYRAAIDAATDTIIAALDKGGAGGGSAPAKKPASGGDVLFGLVFLLFMLAVPIIFMIIIVRAIARAFTSGGRSADAGWASGSSWSSGGSSWSSNDSSWGSGAGGGSDWGGGGGGDSGFSGGGGDTGGGGSGDSF